MGSWFKNLFFRSGNRSNARTRHPRNLQSKLALEALETRLMPAANLSLGAGNVLVVTETRPNAALSFPCHPPAACRLHSAADTFTPPTNLGGSLQLNGAHNILAISNLSGYSKVEVLGGAGDAATLSSPSFGTGAALQSGFSGGEGFDRVQGLGSYAGEIDVMNFPTVTFNSGNVNDIANLNSFSGAASTFTSGFNNGQGEDKLQSSGAYSVEAVNFTRVSCTTPTPRTRPT